MATVSQPGVNASGGAVPQIFVSYAHEDDPWRLRLFGAEFIATAFGDVQVWSDQHLRAGDRWEGLIAERLHAAQVAVVLVSPNLVASTFIRQVELPALLAREAEQRVRIVWVPIGLDREPLQRQLPELAALQAAHDPEYALPAHPALCEDGQLDRVRERILWQLRSAIDRSAANLARELLPRYQLGRLLGEGNRARVYLATDTRLGREVAVKALHDNDPRRRQAFMDQVRRALRVSEEPNFINLYDCAPRDSMAWCVQQRVQGRTLRERLDELAEPRRLPVALVRRIFERLVNAIARAHGQGISYGNLKPGNVILDAEDEPFILPVGRRRDEPRDTSRLQPLLDRLQQCRDAGLPARSADREDLAYLVPDQFSDDGQPVDPFKVDQYMLGLLVWEMVAGRCPEAVANPHHLLDRGRGAFRALPPLSAVRPLCPQRIVRVVARMCARFPSQRYADLAAVLAELQAMPDVSLLVVQDSWQRVNASAEQDSPLFQRFYLALFRRAPEAQQHFAGFGPDRWRRLHHAVHEAVLLLIAFHQQGDPEAEPHVLSRLRDSHRGIPSALYQQFAEALVDTLCGDPAQDLPPADPLCRTPRERDALQEHWLTVLAPGVEWLSAQQGR